MPEKELVMGRLIASIVNWGIALAMVGALGEATMVIAGRAAQSHLMSLAKLNNHLTLHRIR